MSKRNTHFRAVHSSAALRRQLEYALELAKNLHETLDAVVKTRATETDETRELQEQILDELSHLEAHEIRETEMR